MAHNNGSTVKRGILRPGTGGSRVPFFIIVALSVFCVILLYNVYSGAANKTELEEEINVMRVKNHMCTKDRIDTEKKYELLSKTMKQKSESDSQKIKSLQSTNAELTDQLKTLNSQLVEFKDSKTSVDEQISQLQESKNKLNESLTETLNELKTLRLAAEEKAKVEESKVNKKTENVEEQKQQSEENVVESRAGGLKSPSLENKQLISKEAGEQADGEHKLTTSAVKPKRKQLVDSADANLDQPPRFNVQKETNEEKKIAGAAGDGVTEENSAAIATEVPQVEVGVRKKNRKPKGRRNKMASSLASSVTTTPVESEVVIGKKKSKSLNLAGGLPDRPPGPPSTAADNESNAADETSQQVKSNLSQNAPSADDTKAVGSLHTSDSEVATTAVVAPSIRNKVNSLQASLPEKLSAEKHQPQDAQTAAPDDAAAAEGDDDVTDKHRQQRPDALGAPPKRPGPPVSLKLKPSNDNKAKEDYQYRDNEDDKESAADTDTGAVAKGNRPTNTADADDA